MRALLDRFLHEDDAATAIEYGLIAGLVAVVLIGALTLTGTSLQSVFNNIATQLGTVAGSGSGGSGSGTGSS
jgi:pilus assembly protein Flp/PilA